MNEKYRRNIEIRMVISSKLSNKTKAARANIELGGTGEGGL